MLGGVVRIVCTVILGMGLGFFVAVSGFADGSARERAIVIGVILLAYGLVGLGLGFRGSAWNGLGLAVPGLGFLLLLALGGDGAWWTLGYAALIAGVAVVGAYVGVRLGEGRTGGGMVGGGPQGRR